MDKKTRQAVVPVVALTLLLIAFAAQLVRESKQQQAPPPPDVPADTRPGDPPVPEAPPADPSVHLAMGNPSGATDVERDETNYLVRKPYFALSYNAAKGGPNWVSWCLKSSDFGPAARVEFYPDTTLPSSFRHVTPRDYANTGFDRGHLCPRSDRTSTPEASKATFVMSNIVPQSPHLNQRAWNDFEDYCRSQVRNKPRALYIVAGPQGTGGEGSKGAAESIAGGRVAVPAKCWKVALAVENGTGGADDVAKVTASSRVIAVIMPNDQTVNHGWAKYRTSVKEVEALTGYRFFGRVPPAVLDPLKARVDAESIPRTPVPPVED